jgi:hypothetical protein
VSTRRSVAMAVVTLRLWRGGGRCAGDQGPVSERGEGTAGLGERRAQLPAREVVVHEPGQALTMRIPQATLPFHRADIRFRLEPDGTGTLITVSPLYHLRFGPLGSVLDAAFGRGTCSRGMSAPLGGLMRHVESASGNDAARQPHIGGTLHACWLIGVLARRVVGDFAVELVDLFRGDALLINQLGCQDRCRPH